MKESRNPVGITSGWYADIHQLPGDEGFQDCTIRPSHEHRNEAGLAGTKKNSWAFIQAPPGEPHASQTNKDGGKDGGKGGGNDGGKGGSKGGAKSGGSKKAGGKEGGSKKAAKKAVK